MPGRPADVAQGAGFGQFVQDPFGQFGRVEPGVFAGGSGVDADGSWPAVSAVSSLCAVMMSLVTEAIEAGAAAPPWWIVFTPKCKTRRTWLRAGFGRNN
jgi:hypothetical protein